MKYVIPLLIFGAFLNIKGPPNHQHFSFIKFSKHLLSLLFPYQAYLALILHFLLLESLVLSQGNDSLVGTFRSNVSQAMAFETSPGGGRVRWAFILRSWHLGSNLGWTSSGFRRWFGASLVERLVSGEALWWFFLNSLGVLPLLNCMSQYTNILKSSVLLQFNHMRVPRVKSTKISHNGLIFRFL